MLGAMAVPASCLRVLLILFVPPAIGSPRLNLTQLLAPAADAFFADFYQKHWLHVPAAGSKQRQLQQLWSQQAAESWLWSHKNSLVFPKDGDVALDGLKLFGDEQLAPTLQNLYVGYSRAGTVVLQGLKEHPLLFETIVALESTLGVPVSANSYLSPSVGVGRGVGQAGFNFHWDQTDTLILQAEGTKLWSVCERKWPLPIPSVMLSVREAGLVCENLTMSAGDVMYMPVGTVHKAWPHSPAAAVHLTIAIDQSMQSWGRIIVDLFSLAVQDVCTALPTTAHDIDQWETELLVTDPMFSEIGIWSRQQLRLSLNDDDLPKGEIEQIGILISTKLQTIARRHTDHSHAHSFIPAGCSMPAAEILRELSEDPVRLRQAVRTLMHQLRLDFVGRAMTAPPRLTGQIGANTLLIRRNSSRVALVFHDESGQHILATRNEGQAIRSPALRAALQWALSWHSDDSAQGRAFSVHQIVGKSLSVKLEAARLMLNKGLVDVIDRQLQGDYHLQNGQITNLVHHDHEL